ncbi:MAG: helix-turn-helix transcriptional regulator [Clostridia bacterium]|nr:helix-turn-helix transcriptional regulator [Clostridia bacterium]
MAWLSFEIKEQVRIEKVHSFFKLHFDKGHNFAGEMHDFWEVVYVVDGEVIISADENIHNFKSGDIIFHKPLELHKFNVVGDEGVTLFVFSFSMSGEICKKLERKAYHLDKYGRSMMKSFIEFYEYECEKIFEQDSRRIVHLLSYLADDSVFLQTLATHISHIVLALSNGANTLSKTKTHETELFKRALEVMNERVAGQLSVSELAAILNISASSLKRLFDKYAGMSVHKYFLTIKIKTATLLLKEGMSVSEVSDVLGFSSQGYFSATYKRETGNNPSQI